MYSKEGTPLTSTEEVVKRWKEHFEKLLNLTNTPSMMEAELEADGGSSSISLVEVTSQTFPQWQSPWGLMRSSQ